jgi:hypothetical protein
MTGGIFIGDEELRDDRLPEPLVGIHADVNGIEQSWLGQMQDCTATAAGAQDGVVNLDTMADRSAHSVSAASS